MHLAGALEKVSVNILIFYIHVELVFYLLSYWVKHVFDQDFHFHYDIYFCTEMALYHVLNKFIFQKLLFSY